MAALCLGTGFLLPAGLASFYTLAVVVSSDTREALLANVLGTPLVLAAVVDLKRRVLPNALLYPVLTAAFAVSWAWPDRGPLEALTGSAVGFAFLFFPFVLSNGRVVGGGDVKLAALVGAVVGLPRVLPALAVAVGSSAATLVVYFILSRRLPATIPFGPYLALGGLVALLWGDAIIQWYID